MGLRGAALQAAIVLGLAAVSWSGLSSGVQAQGAFCPTIVAGVNGTPDQSGFAFSNGACTNGNTGAFSGAALASQALSDLSQTTTQETSRATSEAVSARREQEAQRCPEGFARVGGVCERIPSAEPLPPSARRAAEPIVRRRMQAAAPAPVRRVRRAEQRRALAEPVPAPILLPPEPVRFSTWAHGFGDYEERSGRGLSNIACCTSPLAAGPAGLPTPLFVTLNSKSSTAGFLAGIDMTMRNVAAPGDGVVVGVLAGYIDTVLDLRSSTISSNPGQVANGFGRLRANLTGPSAGLFSTYFNGPFSADLTLKFDLYDLNETFVDQLGFSANLFPGSILRPAVTVPFAGRASTGLTNTSVLGNLNYRIPLTATLWTEPTVGIRYTHSAYDASAAQLGLADGDLLRLQGGVRLGSDLDIGSGRLTTVLTGLVYSDVLVSGGFIPGAGFGTGDLLGRSDEGKARGQGILTLNYDFGNGVSTFVQGDVRGGTNLFGAGGKGGVRVVW